MSLAMYAPHVDHGGGSRKKRPVNSGSTLLDSTDNQRLFALIGQDNVSLSAGVVELLEANGREWKRTARGVVSLIKDYQKRSYFMRLYDVWSGLTIWEFHLYKGFEAAYHAGCLNLLTFDDENDSKVLALNFSSQEEAANFKLHLDKRREQEQKSAAQKNMRSAGAGSMSAAPFAHATIGAPATRHAAVPSYPTSGVTQMGTVHQDRNQTSASTSSRLFPSWKDRKKKDKTKRIRKEDISNPTNFQHKAHVGWDQDNGFSNNMYDSEPMDESIRNIILAAGKDPSAMNKKDIKFVREFVKNYSEVGEDVFAQQQHQHPTYTPRAPASTGRMMAPPLPNQSPHMAPPPPSRGASFETHATREVPSAAYPPSRPPPPPPMAAPQWSSASSQARPLPQVPPGGGPAQSRPPPPPELPKPTGGPPGPPPPPPPPPPPGPPPPPSFANELPKPQPGRGNLLAEIQAGKQLRSAAAASTTRSKSPSGGDARSDVMTQIRQGTNLKHIDVAAEQEKRKSASSAPVAGGIADALRIALENRRIDIEDSDENESDNAEEWESDSN